MALVTEPIALDKSLNTTEQISRNIADVLAEELSAIITAIGGLNFINFDVVQELPTTGISTTTIYLVPSDDPQSGNTYDEYINLNGTVSGWEKIGSTDIDLSGYYTSAEVDTLLADKADVSDIPTVNDGTLTIQQNGETKATFTANQSGNSTVNIEIPTTDIQTAVDEFETYNGGLLSSLKVTLEPIQSGSGDPSPDNVRPISGHTQVEVQNHQKNLFNPANVLNLTISTTPTIDNSPNSRSIYVNCEPNTTYTISKRAGARFRVGTTAVQPSVGVAISDFIRDDTASSITITTGENAKYIMAFVWNLTSDSGVSDTDMLNTVQVELGSTATAYVPYNGYQITVNLGGTYYSGILDIVSGVFTVDKVYCKLADQTLIRRNTDTSGIYRFAFIPSPAVQIGVYVNVISNALVSRDAYKSYNHRVENCITPDANGNYINMFASDKQTDTAWITFATNKDVEIVYPLATPQTIQLTPTMVKALVGDNHLSTPLDGQEITESKYKKMFTFDDVIAYIQSLS